MHTIAGNSHGAELCGRSLQSLRESAARGEKSERQTGKADHWCRRGESNPRPRDYETLALPLSYAGTACPPWRALRNSSMLRAPFPKCQPSYARGFTARSGTLLLRRSEPACGRQAFSSTRARFFSGVLTSEACTSTFSTVASLSRNKPPRSLVRIVASAKREG